MAIYVFKNPGGDSDKYITESLLLDKVSRYGWSYEENLDLKVLKDKPNSKCTPAELEAWQKAGFLLKIQPGDWIVHVNIPEYGKCIAGKVKGNYYFDLKSEFGDFANCFQLENVIEFDRNAPAISPYISRRLKLMGSHWQIYNEKEFEESIARVRENGGSADYSVDKSALGLQRDFAQNELSRITELIHKNYPGKDLERLALQLIEKIPNVENVKDNGSGWKTDYGADLIITFNSGIPDLNFGQQKSVIVQVKSFEGTHDDRTCVDQLRTAYNKFHNELDNIAAEILFTTGNPTGGLQSAIDELSKELDIPVSIIGGGDVAKLFLKYGIDMITE